jgi:hypothetical protein
MTANLPRGIRNNNPLNIIESGIKWQGMADKQSDTRFISFKRPEDGIRAASKILQTYQEKHGINTLRGVITRWAPPIENDTSAYIASVSIRADIDPDDPLNLTDYKTAYRLLRSMTWMENGKPPEPKEFWYPDDIWEKGLRMAGLNPDKPLMDSRTTTGVVVGGTSAAVLAFSFLKAVWPEHESLITDLEKLVTEHWVEISAILVGMGFQGRALFARVDDKMKGRL